MMKKFSEIQNIKEKKFHCFFKIGYPRLSQYSNEMREFMQFLLCVYVFNGSDRKNAV